jgi:alcohol dehydrogenase
MLRVIATTGIDLERLVGQRIGLDDVPVALAEMNNPVSARAGVTVAEVGTSRADDSVRASPSDARFLR